MAKKTDTKEVWERISFWRIIVRFLKMFRSVGRFWPMRRAFAALKFGRLPKENPDFQAGLFGAAKKSTDGDAEADIVRGRDFFQDAAG